MTLYARFLSSEGMGNCGSVFCCAFLSFVALNVVVSVDSHVGVRRGYEGPESAYSHNDTLLYMDS